VKILALVSLPLLILCPIVLTLSPRALTPPTRTDSERLLRELEGKFAAAVAAKQSEAFLAFWADDAATFPPGKPVVTGKEKILEDWAPILGGADVSLTWEPDKEEMAASGDLGYTYGRYRYRGNGPDGRPVVHNGKYVTIWRKEQDGRWRIVVDIGTPSDPPPAAPAQ